MPVTIEGVAPSTLSRTATAVVAEALPSESQLIATKVAPIIHVDPIDFEGHLWVKDNKLNYGQDEHLDLTWADDGSFQELDQVDPSTVSYGCSPKGGKLPLTKRRRQRSRYPGNLRDDNLLTIRRTVLIELERSTANYVTDPANHGANTSPLVGLGGSGVKMGAAGDAPFGDVLIGRDNFRAAYGFFAPAVTMGWTVLERLRRASDMRTYYGNDKQRFALPEDELLAFIREVLKVQQVNIGSMPYNTANPADALSISDIWGDFVLFHTVGDASQAQRMAGGAEVSGGSYYTVIEDTPEGMGELSIEGYRWETEGGTEWDAAGFSRDPAVDTGLGSYLITDCI